MGEGRGRGEEEVREGRERGEGGDCVRLMISITVHDYRIGTKG